MKKSTRWRDRQEMWFIHHQNMVIPIKNSFLERNVGFMFQFAIVENKSPFAAGVPALTGTLCSSTTYPFSIREVQTPVLRYECLIVFQLQGLFHRRLRRHVRKKLYSMKILDQFSMINYRD